MLRRQEVDGPSASESAMPWCRCGSTRSTPRRNSPPNRKPTAGAIHAGSAPPTPISIAGASSDQKLAAIITPAAKASIPSSVLRVISRARNTPAAPKAVTNQVNSVASSAWSMG